MSAGACVPAKEQRNSWMGNGLMLSMKVIRYRSRIAEALLACAAKGVACDKEALVIEASRDSMDDV
ncbi:hypothetical protein ACW4FQ_31125, partial [Escherichia coli]